MRIINVRMLFYGILYRFIDFLTYHFRLRRLIELKITIGLLLLANKASKAQEIVYPNKADQTDTINLDVEMTENVTTLCYEVVIVKTKYKKKEPQYTGGQRQLNKFVRQNVIYPKEALDHHISGNVAVNLTIDEDGTVKDAAILKSIGYGLDEEALRLVKSFPKFKPGMINHKTSTMNKTVIFHFEMPGHGK